MPFGSQTECLTVSTCELTGGAKISLYETFDAMAMAEQGMGRQASRQLAPGAGRQAGVNLISGFV